MLFLDEPTLGLDPQTRNYLWEYIEKLNRDFKISVIITTHYMDEADRLCDRIGIIDQGKIVALNTPENLKKTIGGDVITVKSPDYSGKLSDLNESWIEKIENYDGFFTIALHNAEEHLTEVVEALIRCGIKITSVSVHKPTLEDVFLHYTGRNIRDEEAGSKDNMRMAKMAGRH